MIKYNVKANFLQYFGICEAIKSGYNMKNNIDKMEQPLRPDAIALICKFSKGCSHIYSLFQTCQVNKKECKSLRKWKLHFNIDEKSWQSYCSITLNNTIDVDLRWFQYTVRIKKKGNPYSKAHCSKVNRFENLHVAYK